MKVFVNLHNEYFLDRAYRDDLISNENFSTLEYLAKDSDLDVRCEGISEELSIPLAKKVEKLLDLEAISSWFRRPDYAFVDIWADDYYDVDDGLEFNSAENEVGWGGIHFDAFEFNAEENVETSIDCIFSLIVEILRKQAEKEKRLNVLHTIEQSYPVSTYAKKFINNFNLK